MRHTTTFSIALLLLSSGGLAIAQPGFGPPGPPRGPGEFGGPPGDLLRLLPVMAALDKDGDGEISAEEIANATAALTGLDANQDGKLTFEELRPDFRRGPEGRRPEGPPGRGPGDRGPEDRGPGDRGPEDRGPRDRGPGDRGPEDRGPRDRGPGDRGPEDRGPEDRGPEDRGPEDRGTGDRGTGDRGPEGRGARDRGPAGGPRDAEEFIKRAFEFDADKDGKLSKEELTEMVSSMSRDRWLERRDERRFDLRERD